MYFTNPLLLINKNEMNKIKNLSIGFSFKKKATENVFPNRMFHKTKLQNNAKTQRKPKQSNSRG